MRVRANRWTLTASSLELDDLVEIDRSRMSRENYFSFMTHLMQKDWWHHWHTVVFTELYSQHLRTIGASLYEKGTPQ